MRTLQFGISLAPNVADMSKLREPARLADTPGLNLLGTQDHPYFARSSTASSSGSKFHRTNRSSVLPAR
jgi:hypothetical protein